MDSVEKPCNRMHDRISELPENLIDCIFERMSMDAAARTSILSRKWRYIWASSPKLVLDEHFFIKMNSVNNQKIIQYEFPKAINKILIVHNGPIHEFSLHIPNIRNDLTSEIGQWMLLLSRNGIQKSDLIDSNTKQYILPCCIFSCVSLTDMKLNNCILNPPYKFGGFQYLVKLYLLQVSFSAGVSATLMHNLPFVRSLTIMYCNGIDLSNVCAPELEHLSMVECVDVNWQWFERTKKLTKLQIVLGKEVNNVEQNVNMIKFLNYIPKITELWLDGFSLKFLAAGNLSHSQTLPPTLLFLTDVSLQNFGINDVYQLSSALCLLKNCPNLLILRMEIVESVNNDIERVTECLEPSNCMGLSLEKLQTVKVKSVTGQNAELLLIKLLLARSTHLQKMIIKLRTGITTRDDNKILGNLMRFPRSSTIAEIIYKDPWTVADLRILIRAL